MGMLVTANALLQCSMGKTPCPLQVIDPTVQGPSGAVANIMDSKFPVNISNFGMCTSPTNPTVIAKGGAPSPCVPATPGPWVPGCPTVLVRNMPALDSGSTLVCALGGTIQVTFPGQVTVTVG